MILEILPVVDDNKRKFKLQVDNNEPEILEKTGLRIRIGNIIRGL